MRGEHHPNGWFWTFRPTGSVGPVNRRAASTPLRYPTGPPRQTRRSMPLQARESGRARGIANEIAVYGEPVPTRSTAIDVRKAAFANFVARQLRYAKDERGWSVPQLARVAGISNQSIYRWRDGNWARSPQPEQVVAFCDALDVPPTAAFAILWPGKSSKPAAPDPAPMDPDVEALLRMLASPSTSDDDRLVIRATIRGLVARSSERPSQARRKVS
jgi:transcriptional regulator with XRE-family HTH domain